MFRSTLIVCVGNICRSPMAQCLLQETIKAMRVESAGLAALVGRPADSTVMTLMRDRGLDVSAHRARQVTPELASKADLILVMEVWQRRELETQMPWVRGKVYLLGHFGGFDVTDPHGQPVEVYRAALSRIEQGVADWSAKLC